MAQGTAVSYTPRLQVTVPARLVVELGMLRRGDRARRVGTSAGTVSSGVNGQRVPDPASCDRIVDGLSVDIDEVLTLVGQRSRLEPDEVEEVRPLVALMRGMPAHVRQQVVEFAEWHRDRPRLGQGGK